MGGRDVDAQQRARTGADCPGQQDRVMAGERARSKASIAVLGAGPAGLGAAWKLATRGFDVQVYERQAAVGGNAGSFQVGGVRVDYGSHRLHPSCDAEILSDIRRMLGDDLLDRPRHGRIRLQDRWLHFPLKPADLVRSLPISFTAGIARDAATKPFRRTTEQTFSTVLEQGLGSTICRDFYFPYARKIWGVDPSQLDAEQARRRVSAGSLTRMMSKVLRGLPGMRRPVGGRFFYPRGGFGQIADAYHQAAVERGATVRTKTSLDRLLIDGSRVVGVVVRNGSGPERINTTQVLSTIPIPALARAADPQPDAAILRAVDALQFRAMILVYLVLGTDRFTEYDAHYFPDATVPITRLSEPKNYGLAQVAGRTVLCAEIPCSTSDSLWAAGNDALAAHVLGALESAGLGVRAPLVAVESRRLSHAYPIYLRGYREHFDRLDRWASALDGLVTLGRQGLFAHDNTHHTLAMAYSAARCLDAEGRFDRGAWAECRRAFESHVVED
jgi:protoporphyrinogen oxidase